MRHLPRHKLTLWGLILLACAEFATASERMSPTPRSDTKSIKGSLQSKVVLKALDKVSGHVNTLELPVNQVGSFGDLKILVKKCWKADPEERPQATAYIEILEHKPLSDPSLAFKGWMFAANPSISAMEHPVYDVWLKDCTGEMLSEAETLSIPYERDAPQATHHSEDPQQDESLNGHLKELLEQVGTLEDETND